jgi:hypothetical protein
MANHARIADHIVAHLPISHFRFLEFIKYAEVRHQMERQAANPLHRPGMRGMALMMPRHVPAIPPGVSRGLDALECITDPIALESPRGALLWLIRGSIPYERRVSDAIELLVSCFINADSEAKELCEAALSKLRVENAQGLDPRFVGDLMSLLIRLWQPLGRREDDDEQTKIDRLERLLRRLDDQQRKAGCKAVWRHYSLKVMLLEPRGQAERAEQWRERLAWFQENSR